MCKVSIISVCKNEVGGIRRTLESVSSQSFGNFEHIVIDGGSTDGTQAVINEYKEGLSYFVSEDDAAANMNGLLGKILGELDKK